MNDLISRQAAIDACNNDDGGHAYGDVIQQRLRLLPSAQPEQILCRDCKHFHRNIPCVSGHYDGCDEWLDGGNEICVEENEYCSRAERREDE